MSITSDYRFFPNKMSRYYPVPTVSNLITYNSAKHIQCIPKETKNRRWRFSLELETSDFIVPVFPFDWERLIAHQNPFFFAFISFKMKVFGLLDVVDGLEIHSFHQRAVSQAGDVGEIGADGINKVAHSPF